MALMLMPFAATLARVLLATYIEKLNIEGEERWFDIRISKGIKRHDARDHGALGGFSSLFDTHKGCIARSQRISFIKIVCQSD